jgi:VWFA-related protein
MNHGLEQRSCGPCLIPVGPAFLRAWRLLSRAGKRCGALLLLLALQAAGVFIAAQALAGQNSSEQEIATQEVQSTFKLQVQRNMVLVRVIVRDANGRPVSGLGKADFRLFDNGKPQEIDQFAVESTSPRPAIEPQAPAKPSEEGSASGQAPGTPIPRNYQALYLDDVQMKFEDIAHSRDAAERFLAATLTPSGRVAIFTSSGQGNLDFTDDRSKIHDTLYRLMPRPIITPNPNACPDIEEYQAYLMIEQRDPFAMAIATDEAFQCECQGLSGQAAQSCQSQAALNAENEAMRVLNQWQTQSTGVLRGLEQVVRRTSLLPGQRNVIFVSPGFLSYNLETEIEDVAERALRYNVIVNTLDPRGLYVVIPGGDASKDTFVIPSSAALMGRKNQIITDGIARAEDVLFNLASDTGGQFFHNNNDLDKGFRLVGTLSEVSYVLAFSPNNLKYDGRFHKLKVSLANPAHFTIQARRGYFAPQASQDAATKAKQEIEDAIYSQDEMKELPVDVHTRFFKLNDSDARLAVLTHLDVGAIPFRKQQDRNLDDVTFITVLFDRDGKYVIGKEKRVEFRLRDSTLTKLSQTGITLKTEFDLKPGTYLVRQIVRDSEAGRLSGLNSTVEIPY